MTTHSEKVNIDDFYIVPNSFLTIKSIGDAFFEYLKKEVNQEPLEFLLETQNFKKDKSEEDIQLFYKLYNNFIKIKCQKQINLSGKTVKEIEKFIKEHETNKTLNQTPYECLYDAIHSISMDLMYDSFPRFVRSEEGLKLITQNIDNKMVAILNNSHHYPYTMDDFMIPFCQEKDILFLTSLMNDSFEWELLYSQKSKINSYVCKRNYFPNITKYKFDIHKTDMILDCTLECSILSIIAESSFQKWDKTVVDFKTVMKITPEEIKEKYKDYQYEKSYDSVISQLHFNFGFPLSTERIVPHSKAMTIIDKNTICMISKPFLDEKYLNIQKKNDKYYYNNQQVLLMPVMSAYLYKKISPTKTKFTQIHCIDLLGWGGLKYFEKISVRTRGELLVKNLGNYLNQQDKQILKFKYQKDNMREGKFGSLGVLIYHELDWNDHKINEKKRRGAFLKEKHE